MNDLDFVLRAVDLLWSPPGADLGVRRLGRGAAGADAAARACRPRSALSRPSWSRVDALDLPWVDAKHLPWKRAFILDGTLVELFRADRDERGWFTELRHRRHDWPADVFAANGRLPVASPAALAGYRAARDRGAAAA